MHTLTIYHGAACPIRVRGRHVCRLVEFAEKYRGWHTHATDRTTRRALASAVRAGCIETNEHGQFRFTYPEDKDNA